MLGLISESSREPSDRLDPLLVNVYDNSGRIENDMRRCRPPAESGGLLPRCGKQTPSLGHNRYAWVHGFAACWRSLRDTTDDGGYVNCESQINVTVSIVTGVPNSA